MKTNPNPTDQYATIRALQPALKRACEARRDEFMLELLLGTNLYRAVKRGEITMEEAMRR